MIKPTKEDVQKDMWVRFVRWCLGEGCSLLLNVQEIQRPNKTETSAKVLPFEVPPSPTGADNPGLVRFHFGRKIMFAIPQFVSPNEVVNLSPNPLCGPCVSPPKHSSHDPR